MNISHDGTTVGFKTEPQELFLAEKSGAKPNTVRIVDNDEYEMLKTHTPKKITIRYNEEIFLRTLTNLHFAKLFGKVIVIFSWAHEEHSKSNTSYAHTKSLDQLDLFLGIPPGPHSIPTDTCPSVEEPSIGERFAAITISNGTLALLQSVSHGHTMNMVIKELYERYMCTRAKERGERET